MNEELERLRHFAEVCYAALVAECDLPEQWADAFLYASQGKYFDVDALVASLPFIKEA